MRFLKYWVATILLASPLAVGEEPPEVVRLVYPMSAAEEATLDGTTPANRITPPVKEEVEVDPVTPLGQIRAVLSSLARLEEAQADLKERIKGIDSNALSELPSKKDFAGILPLLEQSATKTNEIETDVESLVQSNKLIGGRIEDIAKTTADLRATVESAQQTIASIERIRTSRWTDYAVIAILALLLLNLITKIVSFVGRRAKVFLKVWERVKKELREGTGDEIHK